MATIINLGKVKFEFKGEYSNTVTYNVDDIVVYQSEDTFISYLESGDYDVRFLGDDYSDGSYSGKDVGIPIVWITRGHGYSTTKLKVNIAESVIRSNRL